MDENGFITLLGYKVDSGWIMLIVAFVWIMWLAWLTERHTR